MEKKDIIILVILSVLVVAGLTWQIKNYLTSALPVSIKTDKTEYDKDSALKVVIENDSGKSICFSSCYPYYIEKKDGQFESYSYSSCSKQNLNESCVGSHQTKFFQINLNSLEDGFHRLVIPACLGCEFEGNFREDQRFYSNEFVIK